MLKKFPTTATIIVIGIAVVTARWIQIDNNRSWLLAVLTWSVAQWIPIPSLHIETTQTAWNHWKQADSRSSKSDLLDVPSIDVSHRAPEELLSILQQRYGTDWRRRPLLLQNLWSIDDLSLATRRLSLQGLLQEPMDIPYFTNAALPNTLSPDAIAPLSEVLFRITQGLPHKIATQLFIAHNPELITEVAPPSILTPLFGNYFTSSSLSLLTTVPLFIAKGSRSTTNNVKTELHCEPIANIAVQLEGSKSWKLMDSQHWWKLQPSLAADGRAFVSGTMSENVPRYEVMTMAGDALYIPTWTWHRVDYETVDQVSIGASVFHFRALDYVRNHPLLAVLLIPALIQELVGWKTQ
jgi:Cupin superfamily protein